MKVALGTSDKGWSLLIEGKTDAEIDVISSLKIALNQWRPGGASLAALLCDVENKLHMTEEQQ